MHILIAGENNVRNVISQEKPETTDENGDENCDKMSHKYTIFENSNMTNGKF